MITDRKSQMITDKFICDHPFSPPPLKNKADPPQAENPKQTQNYKLET